MANERKLYSVEVEAALLGAVLVDNRIGDKLVGTLLPKHFYEHLHGRIWSAITRYLGMGKTVTPLTLKTVLDGDPMLEALGGASYLAKLTRDPATWAWQDFSNQIIELERLRTIHAALVEAQAALLAPGDLMDPSDTISALEAKIWGSTGDKVHKPRDGASAINRLKQRQQEIAERGFIEGGVSKLVPDLMKIIGPLTPANVTYIGARPSIGKSTLASSLGIGLAANNHAGHHLHAEMSEDDQNIKFLSDFAYANGIKIPVSDIRNGKLDATQLRQLDQLADMAALLPIRYQCIRGMDINRLRGAVRQEKAFREAKGQKLEWVLVDYVQLVQAVDPYGERISDDRLRVKLVSRGLVDLAGELDLHVIGLCQLGRSVDQRPDRRPMLSDLKEAGNLEEDADNVVMLWRPEVHLVDQEPKSDGVAGSKAENEYLAWKAEYETWRGKMELLGEKVRHGERKRRRVRFLGEFSAVRSASFDPEPFEGEIEAQLEF